MALTVLQREVLRLIAASRIEAGESYVAGGVALNTLLSAPRISRDLDLFHDTEEALRKTWEADRVLLERHGFSIEVIRERPTFVQAIARRGAEASALEWVRESAFRFFPLVTHPDLGLTLHPFDLATNKILALVGRVEVRDWIDAIGCSERIQHLGYLAWAACGKDPGYGPSSILEAAARSSHYSRAEVEQLAFDGPPPDAADLSRRWHLYLREARDLVAKLPPEQAGSAVVDAGGRLYRGDRGSLERDLAGGGVRFHPGTIRGALPVVRPA